MSEPDCFQELHQKEQIEELLTILQSDFPHSLHYCMFIKILQEWKSQNANILLQIFVPKPSDLTSGTSLAIFSMSPKSTKVYMIYSLQATEEDLKESLKNTNRIDWTSTHCEWEGVHERHIEILREVLESKGLNGQYLHNYQYYMPTQKGLNVDIREQPDVQIVDLHEEHASMVDHSWEYRTKETINYIKSCITHNFGFGIQLQNKLISWVVQTHYGGVGMLHTLEDHRKRGYAETLVRKFTKHMSDKNQIPSVVVEANNVASICLNEKIGYEKVCSIFWVLFDEK